MKLLALLAPLLTEAPTPAPAVRLIPDLRPPAAVQPRFRAVPGYRPFGQLVPIPLARPGDARVEQGPERGPGTEILTR
jgi:hypothetical protein